MKNKLSSFFAKIGAKINPVLSAGWNTTKKVGKKFLGFLGGLFIIAAKYGAAAVTGLAGGLIAGLPFAIKGGLAVGGAVAGATSFLGPLAPVAGAASGVITFFTIEAGCGVFGLGAGIVVQNFIDKMEKLCS